MPLSHVLPSLLAALAQHASSFLSSSSAPGAAASSSSSFPAAAAATAADAPVGWGRWHVHALPLLNLVLGLVVFLSLVEDWFGREIALWVDELTRGRYSSVPVAAGEKDASAARDGDDRGAKPGMGLVERVVLVGVMLGVMGSMLFYSNGVFDDYASAVNSVNPHHPHAGAAHRQLLAVGARFASFSILVFFLAVSLLVVCLAPSPRTTLPPLLFLLAPVLLTATLASRFSLAVRTARAGATGAHWTLLVAEPGLLLGVQGWMMGGWGGQSVGEGLGDEEQGKGEKAAFVPPAPSQA